jgi:hypothetical protein
MCKTNTIASYLMKLTKLRDQLGAVGAKVKDDELVQVALNGFSSYWHNVVQVIYGQENLSYLTSRSCGMLSLEGR